MSTNPHRRSRIKNRKPEYEQKVKYVLNAIYNQCQQKTHGSLYGAGVQQKIGKTVSFIIIRDYTKKITGRKHDWIAREPDDAMVKEVIDNAYKYSNEMYLLTKERFENEVKKEKQLKMVLEPLIPADTPVEDLTYSDWCLKTSKIKFENREEVEEYILDSTKTNTIKHFNKIPGGFPEEKVEYVINNILGNELVKPPVIGVFIEEPEPEETVVVKEQVDNIQAHIDAILKDVASKYPKGTRYVPLTVDGKEAYKAFKISEGVYIPSIVKNLISTLGVKDERGTYYYISNKYAVVAKNTKVVETIKEFDTPQIERPHAPVKSKPAIVEKVIEEPTPVEESVSIESVQETLKESKRSAENTADIGKKMLQKIHAERLKLKKEREESEFVYKEGYRFPVNFKWPDKDDFFTCKVTAHAGNNMYLVTITNSETNSSMSSHVDENWILDSLQIPSVPTVVAPEPVKEIIKEFSILWGLFKFKKYGNK
jgi:hypothetical protein